MKSVSSDDRDSTIPQYAIDAVRAEHDRKFEWLLDNLARLLPCESPIELALAIAFTVVLSHNADFWFAIPADFAFADLDRHLELIIVPQYAIGRWRVDFAGICRNGKIFAIECDGHDFHDRTKAQASRDRQRDRALAGRGITTLRFTGSDIARDVVAVVHEIETYGLRLSWDQLGDVA